MLLLDFSHKLSVRLYFKKNINIFYDIISISVIYLFTNWLYQFVNPVVNYMYKLEIDYSDNFALINYLLLITLSLALPKKSLIPRIFFSILIISVFVPTSIISNYTGVGLWVNILLFLSILFSILVYHILIMVFFKRLNYLIIRNYSFGQKGLTVLVLFFSIIMFIILILPSMPRLSSISILDTFENIYDIREDNKLGSFSAYVINWFVCIFLPLSIGLYFIQKRKKIILLSFLMLYLLFQIYAVKAHFFSFIMLLFFGYMCDRYHSIVKYSVFIFYFFVFIPVTFSGSIGYAFFDRFFYTIGVLNQCYFDFFSKNPLNYFSGSKLGFLNNSSNYTESVGYIIDRVYFGSGYTNSSTGYLAAFFSEIGYWGIIFGIFFISIMVLILKLIYSRNKIIGFLLAIQVGFLVMNTPLTDMFLSYGFIFLVFGFFLIKHEKY